MTTDRNPKKSVSGSPKSNQGWLAKCGSLLSSISVRDRQTSGEEPARLVMSTTNKREKKRKRVSSPVANKRVPITMANSEPIPVTTEDPRARKAFNAALGDSVAVDKYAADHRNLVQKEIEIAWDRKMRRQDLGDKKFEDEIHEKVRQTIKAELAVVNIIREMREFEREFLFGNTAGEALPGPDTRDMGGQFLTNKDRIEHRSLLYQISKMVPKGALLHLHFNAELHPERLLEEARRMKNMYVRSLRPLLKDEDLAETEMIFNVMPETTPSEDIFDKSYQGANFKKPKDDDPVWMKWSEFQKQFKSKFRGKYKQTAAERGMNGDIQTCSEPGHVSLEPAENWIKGKMVLSEDEAYNPAQTVNGVWARFNQATRCFKGLLNYESVYKWYIGKAIDCLIKEKVMYAELRPMLLDKSIPTNEGVTGLLTNKEQMRLIVECVKEKQAQLDREGRLDEFPYGLKIVYCTPRSIPKHTMEEEMRQCIELKLEFPDLICGFDLVGAEDRPNHIGFYATQLLAFKATCQQLNIEIPFLFHAGETLLDTGGSKHPENSNLYDAQLLGSKRIGHGYSLLKHPHLLERFRLKEDNQGNVVDPGICIELCPISNELLHLCRNIKEHPYPELLAAGIPCTVNSDNPSLFSNSMSHEFYQVMVGAPTMSVYSWKQLALWSIDYSCLSDAQKVEAKTTYNNTWDKFCHDVVAKYGGLMDGDVINQKEARKAYKIDEAA